AVDIVVANDTVQDMLFRNQGDGRFEELGSLAGIAFDVEGNARGAMGIDIARFRNDADLGVVIGNFANEMTALYVARGGQLQFKDDAVSSGLGPPTRLELTFGVLFADIDLDGRLDILSANGHLEEDINKVQKTQTYEQPPKLYWNCGREHSTEFLPVPSSNVGNDFSRPMVGRSLATADIDGDGDLDCVITASGGRPRLLRNDQSVGHHWLRLRLVGRPPNPEAIGAVIELHQRPSDGAGSDGVQTRFVSPTRGYQSQCELPVTFGLGPSPADTAPTRTISIRWPDGSSTSHVELACDRLHVIVQNDAPSATDPTTGEADTP
ncbi:MAG: CRTAC1 family protein, partial [Planctomycetaceae bacterium]